MPASVVGDISIGHAGFSPSPIVPMGIVPTVLFNGRPCHTVGDMILPHVLGTAVHAGTCAQGSGTVIVGKSGLVVRMMDKGSCGAMIQGSATTVLVGG